MYRPAHAILAARDPRESARRVMALGFSGALTLAGLWGLASGLVVHLVKAVPRDLEVAVITSADKPEPAIAPPKPAMAEPKEVVAVPPPEISVDAPPPSSAVTATASTAPATSDASLSGVASTHTAPPYPALARRLGQHGTVTLRLAISAEGDVVDAQVIRSSGVPELDEAARAWVVAHWKYKPAVNDGIPAASTTDAAVIFDLKNAR